MRQLIFLAVWIQVPLVIAGGVQLDVKSKEDLAVPGLVVGLPAAGKRVAVTPPEYAGTDVFHTIYLPADWQQGGETLPIIFEYTGNYFPQAGSTGEPEDAALGYGLSGGRYIWVSLPYINAKGNDNAVTWWGDEKATVEYAKRNVPRIIDQFNADPDAVFLCGFSRGAIGVNYIGLHDDQIASLWTAFITHDHYDGVKQWNTDWGSPLDRYRSQALKRLNRLADRPCWVSQNGNQRATEEYIRSALPQNRNFSFAYVKTQDILGAFPNDVAKAAHTDRWLLRPSDARNQVWAWMNAVANQNDSQSRRRENR